METMTAFTGRPTIMGVDLAKGRDTSAMALKSREGTRVVLSFDKDGTPDLDRDFIDSLDASRKSDREALCMAFTMLAQARGATVERRDRPPVKGYGGHSIDLHFQLKGVGARLTISNLHGGDGAIISWFNDHAYDRENGTPFRTLYYSPRFNRDVGAGVGRPHHKATSYGTWFGLAFSLDAGLYLAARGEAFVPEATEN